MKAAVVEKPGKLVIKDIPEPKMGPYDALVRVEAAAICNSTDSKLLHGRFPGFKTYPTTLGHECVGTVVNVGERVISYRKGDRVLNACTMNTGVQGLHSGWGAMAQYALAGDFAAMVKDNVCDEAHGFDPVYETQKVIAPDVPSDQAILLSTWREVYSSFEDFGFEAGKSLVVFGGGPVGLSFVMLAKRFDLSPVVLATRSPWKLQKAKLLGADATIKADGQVVEQVRKVLPGGADFVVDAVGGEQIMNAALKLVKFGASVCIYGTVPQESLRLVKRDAPYNWKLIMHQWPDYSKEAAAHEPLCDWIRQGKISSEDFITHQLSFEQIQEGFKLIENNEALKVLLWFHQ